MADNNPNADSDTVARAVLLRYFRAAHDALAWKLDGLSDYDVRRPMTPTGTNLLGLLKHVGSVEYGYLGETFGRPVAEPMPWLDDYENNPNADMYATVDESREDILGFYDRAGRYGTATIEALPLDAAGRVPWWPPDTPVTLHRVLVHLVAEINRHAGHADIVRELIDGAVGLRADNDNLASRDPGFWADYRARVQQSAEFFRE